MKGDYPLYTSTQYNIDHIKKNKTNCIAPGHKYKR